MDPKGRGARDTRPPLLVQFFHFHAVFRKKPCQIIDFFTKLKGLENPGSVTENDVLLKVVYFFSETSRTMSNIEKQRGCQCSIWFDCAKANSTNNASLTPAGTGHLVCVNAAVNVGADVNGEDTEVALIKAVDNGCI